MRHDLEGVYRQHRQGLFTLALTITRDANSAEDAVQAAFERLFRLSGAPPADLAAYAFTVVRNAARDEVRRGRTRSAAEGRLAAWASIYDGQARAAVSEVMDAEVDANLRRAVDELPDDQREAIALRIYGQLSFEQMATVLGAPLPTVASRYRRALAALRSRMEDPR